MKSLKQEIYLYKNKESEILDYFSRKGYSESSISEYATTSMIPLVIIYYFSIKQFDNAEENMIRLCKYYQYEIDV